MALRLDKFLCTAGIGSRREVKEYIKKKKVTVNNQIVTSSELKITDEDVVCFEEEPVRVRTGYKYFVMNKPKGIITATRDNQQKTVIDLMSSGDRTSISPVGRLDKDTTGILLLTDDGTLNHRLMSPKHHVEKTYLVETDIPFVEQDIQAFRDGIDIGDEKPCKSAVLEILSDNMSLVTISEGRYHQVKRMALRCGKTVVNLKRISIGDFKLPEDLEEGEYREMTVEELRLIGVENEKED